MTLDLAAMREALRDATGQDSSDLTNAKADLYLNRSWWEVMHKFDFREKESNFEFDTTDDQAEYAVATISEDLPIEAIRRIAVLDDNDDKYYGLTPLSLEAYLERKTDNEVTNTRPSHYVREADNLILWPTPNGTYSVKVYHWAILSDIATGGLDIPQAWHEIILYGANWRALADNKDYVGSAFNSNIQAKLIQDLLSTKAKEQPNNAMAGLKPALRRTY
jgi:hypothetical protein